MIVPDSTTRPLHEAETSPRSRSQASSHDSGVVAQDFAHALPSQDPLARTAVPPRPGASSAASPEVSPSSASSSQSTKMKLPPAVRTPPSPSHSSTKATTTPPTPGSVTSVGTAGSGRAADARTLDEFGFPRISPPTGYFDGDNEETMRNDETLRTDEGAQAPQVTEDAGPR
ncbi:hypothetical protein JCM11491_003761 [Sporobolomyces phaffii]